MNDVRDSLLGLEPDALETALSVHFEGRGQPEFRVGQVRDWVYGTQARTIAEMTNLPVAERDALAGAFRMAELEPSTVSRSKDRTVKHLWKTRDGELVESVLIPTPRRLTLCLSSQAGCAMGCRRTSRPVAAA